MDFKKSVISFSCSETGVDELTVNAMLVFRNNCKVFQGHFPGNPILPAAIQLAAVRYLCEQALSSPLVPTETGRIKFKEMVKPDNRLKTEIHLVRREDRFHISFNLSSEAGTVSTGTIIMRCR